jgi:hypothetical protein
MQFIADAGETFVFPEKREMVDEARAVELLESDGVASVTAPVRLDLSNKSYSDAAATKLAEKLASFSSITDADIHDMIAGRTEVEALRSFAAIADSLVQNPIVALNISDNALGAKGVEACRDLLIKGTLQRIYVLNNGISEAAGTSYGPYNVYLSLSYIAYYFYNIHQFMRNLTTLIHQRALHQRSSFTTSFLPRVMLLFSRCLTSTTICAVTEALLRWRRSWISRPCSLICVIPRRDPMQMACRSSVRVF